MDTYMQLQVTGTNGETAIGQLEDMITQLEQDWSVTRQDSLLQALHRGEEIGQQPLLEQVQALQKRTGGLFDPYLYNVSACWGFYDKQYGVPTDEALQQAMDDRQLDLGGALKGYCGDLAVEILDILDVDSAILNLGGSIQTFGTKADGTPWQIGIQNPNGGDPAAVLSVTGTMAVVTSGDYQRYFEADGVHYHHIIDPRTGYPADSGLRSVTILCQDGLTADCLSTALFVMGLEDAVTFWRESDDFQAVFITSDGEIYATEGVSISGCEYEVICR